MKKQMMKGNYILTILLLLILALTGCGQAKETPAVTTAFDTLWADAPKGTLAAVINIPSAEQLVSFPVSEKLMLEATEERFLLIPAENVDSITIWSIEFTGGDFKQKDTVYENRAIGKNFVLDLTAMRPEGGPHFQISLESASGSSNYYITYNGKDGNPNIEYITADLDK